ncbi:alkaline phosphatase family protein [Candidatus Saccharibacteria bacterium]|nr:alkaline phosphatase family protein [Candidatus Saccharibacteria bacterium]
MRVLNNYSECPTNLACSIRRYFGLTIKHETLKYIDDILKQKQPENVVIILLDGMGTNIMNRTLSADSFLRSNTLKNITTVFPATTTAATTSIRTGLNPAEHGWIGWTAYLKPIDKVITLFLDSEKGRDEELCEDFLKFKKDFTPLTIAEEINRRGEFSSVEIMPFGDDAYEGLDDMINRIEHETKKPGKKYIYAYDVEPDSTMHKKGPDSPEAKALIEERNAKIEKLSAKLENTLLIVTADHGHVKVENVFLHDYPKVANLLDRQTSIDQRAISFKIKPGKKQEFKKEFNRNFGESYSLYDANDVFSSKLFGDGIEHELFRAMLGDYLAIATSNKCLVAPGDEVLISQHAGYTDDEIYVPIIAKYC